MKINAFITHKVCELFSDCQDRFSINPENKAIAVSDGMGSTWQQKIWAQLLVSTFTENVDWYPTIETIKPLCDSWREEVKSFIQNLKEENAPENMIYRNERNLAERRSAGATFVGVRFNDNKWSGSVLGDSCLIEWDGEKAIFYTSQQSESFDSYPDYFDSDPSKEGKGTPQMISGTLLDGITLFLVSDPFSEFLLERSKQGNIAEYIDQFLALSSHEDFEGLVENWRKNGMHNDDTTLVIIEPNNSDIFSMPYGLDDINLLIEKEEFEKTINGKIQKEETTNEDVSERSDTIEISIEEQGSDIQLNESNDDEIRQESIIEPSVSDSNNSDIRMNYLSENTSEEVEYSLKRNDDIDKTSSIVPTVVDENEFVEDFIDEYKKSVNFIGGLNLLLNEKEIKKTAHAIFSKYQIFKR